MVFGIVYYSLDDSKRMLLKRSKPTRVFIYGETHHFDRYPSVFLK